MSLWRLLDQTASAAPAAPAVVDGEFHADYALLRKRSAALAGVLASLGVSRGDRVAYLGHNSHRFIEAYYAAAALGAVLVPLNHRLAPPELAFILGDAGASGLIADVDFHDAAACGASLGFVIWSRGAAALPGAAAALDYEDSLRGAPEPRAVECGADDLAHLYYTSGTTGRAKGVMLTHGNVAAHAEGTIRELGLTARDAWGHIAPMFHLADAWAVFAVTQARGLHVVVRRFSAEAALDAIETRRITITNLVPTMLNLMVKHPGAAARDTGSLRRILSGGAPIAPDVVRRILEVFRCEYVQTYGLTETSPYLTFSLLSDEQRRRPESERFRLAARTGRPADFVRVRVVDDAGRDVPADDRTVGEIVAQGPTVTRGYWRRPDETRAAFEGGWFRTGDLAVVDADGFLQIVDRKKDMINTGGEKVFSVEVEHCLYSHPAVLEAAVFAAADPVFGERVAAAVVLRPSARCAASELIDHCRERLAHYKAPRDVHFLDELPKTGSGKIMKRELRERFAR